MMKNFAKFLIVFVDINVLCHHYMFISHQLSVLYCSQIIFLTVGEPFYRYTLIQFKSQVTFTYPIAHSVGNILEPKLDKNINFIFQLLLHHTDNSVSQKSSRKILPFERHFKENKLMQVKIDLENNVLKMLLTFLSNIFLLCTTNVFEP